MNSGGRTTEEFRQGGMPILPRPSGGGGMIDLLENQKKLTSNQWLIAGAATLGDMLDFFDFFLIGFVLAFIVKD